MAAPHSTAEVADLLHAATHHDLSVVARGNGTRIDWGAPPTAVDLVVDTTGLTGVVDHAAGDLVVVVRAGTPVAELQQVLAGAAQELALDDGERGATVGGTIAVSPSGPRRLLRGTVRDLLIGITFVRADGVIAKAGGKVVKNVAGYDFAKLLAGSYGTLGLVCEAIFRLHPLPSVRHVVGVDVDDATSLGRATAAVLGSQVVPSAVEVDWPADGRPRVGVLLEGTAEGVAQRVRATADLLGTADGDPAAPPWWNTHPWGSDDVALKVTTRITGLSRVLEIARASAARHGTEISLRGSAAGVVHAGVPGSSDPEAVQALVTDLRTGASAYDGNVVVLAAPPPVREAVDMWGPVPGLALMRRVKDEMDPHHRLAPGRFVGGI